jgi:8-oxo-dGTP pyrophosphatase MutT (NUDIX family)
MSREKEHPLRLGPTGKRDVRTQFGALCWRRKKGEVQVMLVTTRGTGRWIPPKGWPMDGATPAGAAAVEAFEEAGVEGVSNGACLGIYTYTKEMPGDDLPCVVALFAIRVTKVHAAWPEMHQRRRKWMCPKKAAASVKEPELRRLLRDFDPRLPSGKA